MYVAALSAIVVLVFSVIAWAQDSTEQQGTSDADNSAEQQGTSDADSSADQTQSPTPSSDEQEAPPGEQGAADPNEEQEAAPAQEGSTVRILANAFDPPQLDVAPGSTVTFVNEDAVAHTVALEGLFDSYEIAPGSSYSVWLGGGSGAVAYHDKTKPEIRGTIIVGGMASQGGATTPAEPAGEAQQTGSEGQQTGDEDPQANGELPQTDDLLQSLFKQSGLGGSA
jgi:plastocyanin